MSSSIPMKSYGDRNFQKHITYLLYVLVFYSAFHTTGAFAQGMNIL